MQVDSKPEAATTLNSYKSMQTFIKLHIMIIIMCQNSYSEEEEKNRRMFSWNGKKIMLRIAMDVFFSQLHIIRSV